MGVVLHFRTGAPIAHRSEEEAQWEVSGGEHDDELIPGLLASLRDYNEERVMLDVQFLDAHPGIADEADRYLDEMYKYLFVRMGLSPHDRSVELHRQNGMRNASLASICETALACGRKIWAEKPTYLGALVLEYHLRMQWIAVLGSSRGSLF